MKLSHSIKFFISGLFQKIRPLPEHSSAGYSVNIDEGNIILLFCVTTREEFISVNRLINDTQGKYENMKFAVFTANTEFPDDENENLYVYGIDDFNYFGIPKPELKKWLKNNRFDLLLSFADSECFFCSKLINLINADFKVGRYDKGNIPQYDLTIAFETGDYFKQIDQYIYYLKNLNINI